MNKTASSRLTARANELAARFQKFARRHLGPGGDLKVLSVVVATAIYFFIQNIINFSETYTARLSVTVREANVAVRNLSTEEVKVTLKGPEGDVRAFNPSQMLVRLKLSHSEAGAEQQTVKLRGSDVEGAGKLRVGRIEPETIIVEFDNEVEQRLPLALPVLTGKPLQGESSVELMRKHVTVRGPKSKLQKLMDDRIMIPTDTIDVTDKTQGFTKTVKVKPPGDSGISTVQPEEVEAKVEILNIPGPEQPIIDIAPGDRSNLLPGGRSPSTSTNRPAAYATEHLPVTGP